VTGISSLKLTEIAGNPLTVTPEMVLILTVLPILDPAAIFGTNVNTGITGSTLRRYGHVVPVGGQN
jgi:hypothetical protein